MHNYVTSSDFKSQTSLTLLLRHYELTNENVSYFLTNQSKIKTFIDLIVTRKPKPMKNNTRPYLYEIPAHFTHEIKTKGYDVIDVYIFPRKNTGVTGPSHTTVSRLFPLTCNRFNSSVLLKKRTLYILGRYRLE